MSNGLMWKRAAVALAMCAMIGVSGMPSTPIMAAVTRVMAHMHQPNHFNPTSGLSSTIHLPKTPKAPAFTASTTLQPIGTHFGALPNMPTA